MKYKLFLLSLVLVLLAGAGLTAAVTTSTPTPSPDVGAQVKALDLFSASKWTVHYRAPNDAQIESLLKSHGIKLAGPEAKATAVQVFRQEWAERNPTTPNPRKLQKILKNESKDEPATVTGNQFMSLAVPVEFPNSDTFDAWVHDPNGESPPVLTTVTTTGPLHNQIPAPGPRDNNTIWYQDTTPTLYDELYFGVGPKAGVIVQHPNLGTVDLRGNTMANYYLEQSEGKFLPKGDGVSQVAAGRALRGLVRRRQRVGQQQQRARRGPGAGGRGRRSTPTTRTSRGRQYDGNGDGVVDNFTVIHAGMGQEAGGGQQGDFAIWSHASALDPPAGYLASAKGSAGCAGP